jgi:hypothetical protein
MKKLFIPIFLYAFSASAQWNPDPALNNPICVQPNEQVNVKQITDMKGGAIIVWEDYRNDATNSVGDIYAQRISSNGTVMWTTDGVAICTDAAHQSSPTLASDSVGGAVIVWQDSRGTKRNLYAQRIDSSGVVQWAANGVGVTLRNFDQKNPKVLADGSHGAIVLWQDSANNIDYDIYAQRLDGSGAAQWSGGVGVGTGNGSQVNVKAQIDASGNTFATWQDKRNGSDYDIYVQKLNLSGTAQWTSNGVNICNVAGTQNGPKIVLDYTGGAIISWQDKRNGVDYDIYAQRVNSSGAAQWTSNGRAVVTATANQSALDMTSKNISNGVIITWKDARQGSNNIDVYAQKLDLAGAAQWTSNGIAIANATTNQLNVSVISDGTGGAIFCYQDSSANNWDVKAQRVNASGVLQWTAGGVSIGIAAYNQTNPDLSLADAGSTIYSFDDKRNGSDNDIYAYKIDATGGITSVSSLESVKLNVLAWPNPSNGEVRFAVSNYIATNGFTIQISSDLGQILIHESVKNTGKYQLKNKLAPGVYFYTIRANEQSYSGKLVIEQ